MASALLPEEIWMQIVEYLTPYDITKLQQVSKSLHKICLDDTLWKRHCFDMSPWYQSLINRRASQKPFAFVDDVTPHEPTAEPQDGITGTLAGQEHDNALRRSHQRAQKSQDLTNWDPSFPGEKVSWYDEYIQREGPTWVNWMQTPRLKDRDQEAIIEARGVATYSPYEGDDGIGTQLAVAPLDDGSVCLWDINGTRGKMGAIISQSEPDLLYQDGFGNSNDRLRSQRIDSSIADRVSVDHHNHKAFFAIQSHLMELDLRTLKVVSHDSFEWSITTLSSVHPDKPLIVGTSLGIHPYDFRTRGNHVQDAPVRVDADPYGFVNSKIFDSRPLPSYAPLSQPTPTSIIYLPRGDSNTLVTDDIYVSGRFSNFLHYDQRKFPAIVSTHHSGAVINSLAALPYPFSTLDHEVRQLGESTAEKVADMKARDGSTLIAGGSYNQKGSLEVYGLGRTPGSGKNMSTVNSTVKNRYTAASSPILSVTNHGTKIVFSDGSGLLKWFERDGNTECRRIRIGHSEAESRNRYDADDVARKIISTQTKHGRARPNNDNILFWTGERLGLVSFTSDSMYQENDFEEKASPEDQARREYSEQMREALERQADEVRFMGSLGFGTRNGFGL